MARAAGRDAGDGEALALADRLPAATRRDAGVRGQLGLAAARQERQQSALSWLDGAEGSSAAAALVLCGMRALHEEGPDAAEGLLARARRLDPAEPSVPKLERALAEARQLGVMEAEDELGASAAGRPRSAEAARAAEKLWRARSLAAEDPEAALALLGSEPRRVRTLTPARELEAELTDRVARSREERIGAALREAETQLGVGDLEGALSVLATLRADRLSPELESSVGALRELAERERRKGQLRSRAHAALAHGRWFEARRALQELAAEPLDELEKGDVEQELAAVAAAIREAFSFTRVPALTSATRRSAGSSAGSTPMRSGASFTSP